MVAAGGAAKTTTLRLDRPFPTMPGAALLLATAMLVSPLCSNTTMPVPVSSSSSSLLLLCVVVVVVVVLVVCACVRVCVCVCVREACCHRWWSVQIPWLVVVGA